MNPIGLLVSVRNLAEARIARDGGADIVDVKEPANGPLGRASRAVLRAIADELRGEVSLSAALGEWEPSASPRLGEDARQMGYERIKFGLHFPGSLETLTMMPGMVAVAYANPSDTSASPEDVLQWAIDRGSETFLIDTFGKQNFRSVEYLGLIRLRGLRARAADAGVKFALAGGVTADDIRRYAGVLHPDWFAVRGAACRNGERGAELDPQRVSELRAILDGLPAACENANPAG